MESYNINYQNQLLKKAEAELTIAKLNVERCNIIAPYDGRVMDVYTNVFTSIEQRQPLMDIVGDGLLEAAVVVPSKWLSWLKKGHDVKIIIDETGDELNAKIISLGAAVDAASQTIELKAQFNEKYEFNSRDEWDSKNLSQDKNIKIAR